MSTFFNNFFGVKFLVEKAINAIYVARQQYFAFRLGRLCKQIAYLHSVPLLLFRLWCGKIKIETSVFFAILAVCFQRSAFRAHFSPREIGCLPTAMTFARKIRRYCFGVSFLPVSPLGGMVLRMGSGGLPDSRIACCIGATLPRCSSGATCRVTLPDSHQGLRGGALCRILIRDDAREQLCPVLVGRDA